MELAIGIDVVKASRGEVVAIVRRDDIALVLEVVNSLLEVNGISGDDRIGERSETSRLIGVGIKEFCQVKSAT